MLNTIHLHTFLTVVDLGTYSAAAERLHLTQPAVSQQIGLLEKQLGDVRLFRRVAQRMMLTHAGEELLPAAREIVSLAERAETALLALRGHVRGQVAIACAPSSGERLLPGLLALFRERFPAVQVTLEIGSTEQIVAWLAEERVQIGWLDEPQRRRGWETVHLGREALVCGVRRQHPWLQGPPVTVGMLREQPLILPRLGSGMRRVLDETFRRAGIPGAELQIALECDGVGAIVAAIKAGLGVDFLPVSCQPPLLDIGVVSAGGLHPLVDWYLVGNKDAALSRAVHECRSFLVQPEALAQLKMLGIDPP